MRYPRPPTRYTIRRGTAAAPPRRQFRISHTIHQPVKTRLQRSELAVPGSNTSMIDKAADRDADYVFLDLKDAVDPSDRVQSRKKIIPAHNDIDW